jgi:hypothetical protein
MNKATLTVCPAEGVFITVTVEYGGQPSVMLPKLKKSRFSMLLTAVMLGDMREFDPQTCLHRGAHYDDNHAKPRLNSAWAEITPAENNYLITSGKATGVAMEKIIVHKDAEEFAMMREAYKDSMLIMIDA